VALERPELIVTDSAAWRMWLSEHRDSDGVRLVLAKKGTLQPTSLTHREALEEALCFGWIDGQAGPGTRQPGVSSSLPGAGQACGRNATFSWQSG
jgi:hypothetical protein